MEAVCPNCNSLNPVSSKFCGTCGASLEGAKVVQEVARPQQEAARPPEEVTYYSAGGVQIANSRAVLGAKTYAMANITSVTMATKPARRLPGILVAAIGLMVVVIGLTGKNYAVCLSLGLGALVIGVIAAVVQQTRYIVRIGSASGEADALNSKDRDHIETIVNAMNKAIIDRG